MSTAAPRIPAYTSLVLSGVRGAADQEQRGAIGAMIYVENKRSREVLDTPARLLTASLHSTEGRGWDMSLSCHPDTGAPASRATPTIVPVQDRSGCSAKIHGTSCAYKGYGCRCPDAREANRLYRKRLREGRQPSAMTNATGTARRIQALCAIGYPQHMQASELGWTVQRVSQLCVLERQQINRATVAKVAELYGRWWNIPGPSEIARERAQIAGWLAPMWWDDIDDPAELPVAPGVDEQVDEIVVERACDNRLGELQLTRAEQHEVIRRLSATGMTAAQIAQRARVNERTVQRARVAAARPRGEAAA